MEYALFIGGHPDDKRSARVFITIFETYSCTYQEKTPGLLPDEIVTLVDRDYRYRVG